MFFVSQWFWNIAGVEIGCQKFSDFEKQWKIQYFSSWRASVVFRLQYSWILVDHRGFCSFLRLRIVFLKTSLNSWFIWSKFQLLVIAQCQYEWYSITLLFHFLFEELLSVQSLSPFYTLIYFLLFVSSFN